MSRKPTLVNQKEIMAASISWQQLIAKITVMPLYRPYLEIILALGDQWPDVSAMNRVSQKTAPHLALNFVEQHPISRKKKETGSLLGYLERIAIHREVLTRNESVHDLFNFATFVLFPKAKLKLMDAHYHESRVQLEAQRNLPKQGGRGRTRAQDLLTLFDEGGMIQTNHSEPDHIVFGHGILEQYLFHDRRVRAFSWHNQTWLAKQSKDFHALDDALAEDLGQWTRLEDPSLFSGEWVPDALTMGQVGPD